MRAVAIRIMPLLSIRAKKAAVLCRSTEGLNCRAAIFRKCRNVDRLVFFEKS